MVETWANFGAEDIETDSLVKIDVALVCPFSKVTSLLNCYVGGDVVQMLFCGFGLPFGLESTLGSGPELLEQHTVLIRKTEHVVCSSSVLVNWESIKAIRQSLSTKLGLPLGKVSTCDWGHCVVLLPLRQIVLSAGRVETHHLGLDTLNSVAILR